MYRQTLKKNEQGEESLLPLPVKLLTITNLKNKHIVFFIDSCAISKCKIK